MKTRIYVVSGIAWGLIGTVAGIGGTKIIDNNKSEFKQPVIMGVPGSEFASADISYQGNGVFKVPQEAPYGTYQITQGGSNWGCTWTRLKKLDTKDERARIEAGIINRGQFNNVEIKKGDAALWLQGDCIWRQI